MTILPGSLDYLYHYGILDRIPYEAYEILPATQSGYNQYSNTNINFANPYQTQINGNQYLKQAQQGYLYNSNSSDTFMPYPHTAYTNSKGYQSYGPKERNFREEILAEADSNKKISTNSSLIKGTLAGGLILTTIALLIRKANLALKSGIGSKLNPLNWFKK